MHLSEYLKRKVTKVSLFKTFVVFVGFMAAVDQLARNFLFTADNLDPMIWALTFTLGAFSLFGLLNYCLFTQSMMQEEIDRTAKVKSKQQAQVLKKPQSSKKK